MSTLYDELCHVNAKISTDQIIQLVIEFDPSTTIASVKSAILAKLKEQYNLDVISTVKFIYRGNMLDETKMLNDVFGLRDFEFVVFHKSGICCYGDNLRSIVYSYCLFERVYNEYYEYNEYN